MSVPFAMSIRTSCSRLSLRHLTANAADRDLNISGNPPNSTSTRHSSSDSSPGADTSDAGITGRTSSPTDSGCILNGQVEDSVLFKDVYVGNNCVIRNSIILNSVYLGDNTHIENCIVESRATIQPNSFYCGEDGIRIVVEKGERFAL